MWYDRTIRRLFQISLWFRSCDSQAYLLLSSFNHFSCSSNSVAFSSINHFSEKISYNYIIWLFELSFTFCVSSSVALWDCLTSWLVTCSVGLYLSSKSMLSKFTFRGTFLSDQGFPGFFSDSFYHTLITWPLTSEWTLSYATTTVRRNAIR